jgi:nucleoside-triphosphatase
LIRFLLEGRPGVGKTTVIRRLVDLLHRRDLVVSGFTTEEIREGGRRMGFAIESMGGDRAVMAHTDISGPPRVGKYGVDLRTFERIALPALSAAAPSVVMVIDELGKMELASAAFRDAVTQAFDGEATVVATVHRFRHPFTDGLKRRSDVELISVTERSRDRLPDQLVARLLGG